MLDFPSKKKLNEQSQKIYQYKGFDGKWQVGGYYRQVENLTWMVATQAGHQVPLTQLNMTVSLLSDYIANNHSIPCVDTPSSTCNSTLDYQCNAMNQCNDQGLCVQGICRCFNTFFGADCRLQPILVDTSQEYDIPLPAYDKVVLQTAPQRDPTISLSLKSNFSFDLYAMRNETLEVPIPSDLYEVTYFNLKEYLDIPNKKIIESYSDFIMLVNPNNYSITISLSHISLVE